MFVLLRSSHQHHSFVVVQNIEKLNGLSHYNLSVSVSVPQNHIRASYLCSSAEYKENNVITIYQAAFVFPRATEEHYTFAVLQNIMKTILSVITIYQVVFVFLRTTWEYHTFVVLQNTLKANSLITTYQR